MVCKSLLVKFGASLVAVTDFDAWVICYLRAPWINESKKLKPRNIWTWKLGQRIIEYFTVHHGKHGQWTVKSCCCLDAICNRNTVYSTVNPLIPSTLLHTLFYPIQWIREIYPGGPASQQHSSERSSSKIGPVPLPLPLHRDRLFLQSPSHGGEISSSWASKKVI